MSILQRAKNRISYLFRLRSSNLRGKMVYVFVITGISLTVILSLVALLIVQNNFSKLEKNTLESNLTRVNRSLSSYSSDMAKTVIDWSEWDDTYNYAADHNTNYEHSNLVTNTFATLKINLFAVIDNRGNPVSVLMYDLNKDEFTDPPPVLVSDLIKNGFINLNGYEVTHSGIIDLPAGPMIVNTGPILTSDQQGPARGTLLFGRYLDEQLITEIAETTDLDLTIMPVHNSALPQQVAQTLTGQNTSIFPVSSKIIDGYLKITDIRGNTVSLVRVQMPRDIYQRGRDTIIAFVIGITIIAAGFLLVIIAFIERMVLKRLRMLTNAVVDAGKTGTFALDIGTDKNRDEIYFLSLQISAMTRKLTKSQAALKESEKKYATLVEQNNNGILILSDRHIVKYANSAMGDLLCKPLENIIGQEFESLVTESNREQLKTDNADNNSGNNVPARLDIEFERGDGKEITAELSGKQIEIDGEKCVMVVVYDMTVRKQTEKMLQFQKELIDRILATTPNAVMAVDTKNRIFYSNSAFQKMKLATSSVNGKIT